MTGRPDHVMTIRTGAAGLLLAGALVALSGAGPFDAGHVLAAEAEKGSCASIPLAEPTRLCKGKLTLDSAIPPGLAQDLSTIGISKKTGSRMVDCFAWESFVALNWPNVRQCRGKPSGNKAAADDWTSKRVWETYKEPYELFQATDATWDPSSLTFDDPAPEGACGGVSNGNKLLRHSGKFPLLFEDAQAFLSTAVLTDQQGNTVWYEVLMNRDSFDYIRDSGLATTGNYSFGGPVDDAAIVDFPTGENGATGAGTIEIKAAWRQMASDDDLSRYFTQDAVIYDGTDCEDVTVGLVGLHIARKVANSPKWIWATFEHEDNVPPAGRNGDGRSYNFFSKYCARNEPADCSRQVAIVDTDDICCPNLITYPSPDPALSINQVTRITPIQASSKINKRYRKAYAKAGSPFRYFMLVGAQWAKPRVAAAETNAAPTASRSMPPQAYHTGELFPDDSWKRPCNPNGAWAVQPPDAGEACYEQIPYDLRNTSMETLIVQTDKTGTQYSADSCMNCHFAGGVDGSYLWLDAMLNPYEIDD